MVISVIIPAYNEEESIGECLRSLKQAAGDADIEIIVVDNASTDRTAEIAEGYGVRVIKKQGGTISSVRNSGARQAKGDVLAFIDGDCIAPETWIKKALELLSDSGTGAVGSWYALPQNPSWVEKIWNIHTEKKQHRTGIVPWVPSSNFIIKREVFEKINGFNEALITGEDYDICLKVNSAGSRIVSDQALTVVHLGNPKTLKQFFLKEVWRGYGALQMVLASWPKVRINKTLIFAIWTLIVSLSTCLAFGIGVVNNNFSFFRVGLFFLTAPAFLMAVNTVIQKKAYRSFLSLSFLYLIFGLSRAAALLNLPIWLGALKAGKAE